MTNPTNKNLCLIYLQAYANKNLELIETMFSKDIVLRDWKIRVEGKAKAILKTKKNFDNANTIAIDVLSTYESENTVVAELKITVNSDEELYVVDILTFNSHKEIESIRAYLGRGDS